MSAFTIRSAMVSTAAMLTALASHFAGQSVWIAFAACMVAMCANVALAFGLLADSL